jgi:hypothetical protein
MSRAKNSVSLGFFNVSIELAGSYVNGRASVCATPFVRTKVRTLPRYFANGPSATARGSGRPLRAVGAWPYLCATPSKYLAA